MKCPQCHSDIGDDSKFCKECGTNISSEGEAQPSITKTIETSREELTTGSTFANRYQIIEELGRGGMGKVYKALDTEIKERIALKLIKPEIASDRKTIDRFRNELKVARQISHKNVCRMYDLNKADSSYFITMEYIPGGDLKRFIRRSKQLSIETAVSIAKQICEGLVEAHRLGVVHRDLKPNNIMIDDDGNARIMDFGIARSLETKGITGAGVMIGTPEYMSPEQVESKEIDQRSDIYSLGIILYEMMTGRLPFEGDTPFAVGVKQKSELPENPRTFNSRITEDLSRLILKCLEKEKEKRYQSAGEVRSGLSGIEQGLPTTEKETPKRKPLTSREITVSLSPRKAVIPALVVLGIIAVVAVVWQLFLHEGTILPQEKRSIAVISFENQTGDEAYDHLRKVIPNLLITSLEQSGFFQVTTWERMNDLIKQMSREDVEFIDRELGFELCRMEKVDTIILGTFAKAGDVFATDVKVLDVANKQILKSASARGRGEGSILEAQIDELSEAICQGIGISQPKIDKAQVKIADVTTASLEAYEYYLKGLEADAMFYHADARRYYERAIEIDPEFASSYMHLAVVHRTLGNTQAMEDALEKAKSLKSKASRKEQLYIDAMYSWFVDRQPEIGENIMKQSLRDFPKEKWAYYALGGYYFLFDQYDPALEAYNKALELDPNYASVINQLTYVYLNMEDFEKALEYSRQYVSLLPGEANPLDSLAELFLFMGRLDEAVTKYKEVLEIKPDFGSQLPLAYIFALKEDYPRSLQWIDDIIMRGQSTGNKGDGYLWKGFLHYWLGSLEKALEGIQKASELYASVANRSDKAYADLILGWIYYDQGKNELARGYARKSYETHNEVTPVFRADYSIEYNLLLGLIELKQNRLEAARSCEREIESHWSEAQSFTRDLVYVDYLKAEILLAEGSLEEAAAACRDIAVAKLSGTSSSIDRIFYNLPFMRDTLARVFQKKGDVDGAITEYERLVTFDPDSRDRRLINPKFHYHLARLYEEKSWKGKALEHYEKFLDLWKDADPGLPEVVDARERVAELKSP
jgi:serine/threonine protein kinase/Tfp pilus assembly protein PilF